MEELTLEDVLEFLNNHGIIITSMEDVKEKLKEIKYDLECTVRNQYNRKDNNYHG